MKLLKGQCFCGASFIPTFYLIYRFLLFWFPSYCRSLLLVRNLLSFMFTNNTYCLWLLDLWILSAVVILVPTRELALQTSQVCKELGKYLNIQVMVSTGGTSLKDDIMRLYQPVHLLVGTPGRILDLTRKGICVLKDCSMLVMDEVSWVALN